MANQVTKIVTPHSESGENSPHTAENSPLRQNKHSTYLSQALQILTRVRNGATVAEAAAEVGVSRWTAFQRLRLVDDDDEKGVVKLLSAKAIDFAEDWMTASKAAAEKGDHRPARDALLHVRAIEPLVQDAAGAGGVTIVIGTPERPIMLPAQSPQVIEVAAENRPESAQFGLPSDDAAKSP